MHDAISRRRAFAVAPLYERRNTPVADRRYNLRTPPTYFVVYRYSMFVVLRITPDGEDKEAGMVWLLVLPLADECKGLVNHRGCFFSQVIIPKILAAYPSRVGHVG